MIIHIEDYRRGVEHSKTFRLSYPFNNPSLKYGRSWSSHEYKIRWKNGVPGRAEWPVNDSWARSNTSFQPWKLHKLHRSRIPFLSLEPWERCLFLRAFLKYELFSALKLFFGAHPCHEYFTTWPFCRFFSLQERNAVVLVHWHHKMHSSKIHPSTDSRSQALSPTRITWVQLFSDARLL
ncbi:hypothetical protein FOPG_10986 [Fusarium oxysporum f. sp. conglutinans race 2 54008]|uniref:Uncharacterized protein n=1 Tax=Fusarium oxysporum f. sp. conglutinans race 2 54008 TaxID=1089457 RepID=X0HQ83_FUSOX|nr:hypothetical protein FOPG_10986 [Fusarium oxysporum f. sp. conglutinans race 2 54008]